MKAIEAYNIKLQERVNEKRATLKAKREEQNAEEHERSLWIDEILKALTQFQHVDGP